MVLPPITDSYRAWDAGNFLNKEEWHEPEVHAERIPGTTLAKEKWK
jgi:hypothetical protein